jgi:hypothetical protein
MMTNKHRKPKVDPEGTGVGVTFIVAIIVGLYLVSQVLATSGH